MVIWYTDTACVFLEFVVSTYEVNVFFYKWKMVGLGPCDYSCGWELKFTPYKKEEMNTNCFICFLNLIR